MQYHVIYTMHLIETCLLTDFGPTFSVGSLGMAKHAIEIMFPFFGFAEILFPQRLHVAHAFFRILKQ